MHVIKENEMKALILLFYIYVGTLVCSNVHAALEEHHEAIKSHSLCKTCLRVESDEDALYAEGNIASFFCRNKDNIATLKKMGALEENRPPDLDYSRVKELLVKIWNSETRIAACFTHMPEKSTNDLISFQDRVWEDSYELHSGELTSVGQLKQMLNLLSALIDISHKVL